MNQYMEVHMKKLFLLATILLLLCAFVHAEFMDPGPQKDPIDTPQGRVIAPTREVPTYTFTKLPTSLIVNYYDYMIGAYNGLPLRVIPNSAGGGYFMTYHGRRQPTGTRRQFYAYLDAAGNVINNNEITSVQNHEGFGTMVVDPVTGKPMYAWHANADADAQNETQFTSDAFIAGIAGLFNDIVLVCDAPVSITEPGGLTTTDNEFIWPTAVIGPSPVNGKRRIYVGMRNYITHAVNASPSENIYIAYADFDGDDLEMGTPLVWNHTTIPEQDAWNHDTTMLRRPSGALVTDDAGNLYWAGHHSTWDADSNPVNEPDVDIWKSANYGQGAWTRVIHDSGFPVWNPNSAPNDTTGYFDDPDNGNIPYGDNELSYEISNSGHVNSTIDNQGRIHVPGVWAINSYNGYYYPAMQFVKEWVYDTVTQEFWINEIYPQKDPADNVNPCFMPWDMEAPWGVEDGWGGDATNGYFPLIFTAWPFPHWDTTAHTDAMMFHYNGVRVSEPNEQGMMVCVWQEAERARLFNYYSDTDYQNYANTPEIWISVSPNNGAVWSEPIIINNVDTPEFAGLKPMYTYPADKVIYTGMQGGSKVGKIGIMFYNDYTWGSNVNTPPYHPTADGGEVMFMELQIVFPWGDDNDDPGVTVVPSLLQQNYPNPFNPETTISFDMPAASNANLSIFNVKGQLVRTLADGTLDFGKHSYVWNGKDSTGNTVTSGIYFYRLTSGNHVETRKMMLMK
jgi:hypothetical protein